MSKEKKIVPKLRFPEFVKDGVWQEKQLSDVCDITNGKANAQDHIEGGEYPLFDRSEVIKASDKYIFDCETVIIPGEGMRFIPKYYKGKFNLHQRAYALKDFSCNGEFVYHSMLHRSNLISQKAVQSTVLSLRLPILQNFPIEIPKNPKEQQKITSCLSSLNELITAHNDKLESLKDHKKGLMQNLFPQEGQKVPNYRFKEFEDDGDWTAKPLDGICDINPTSKNLPQEFVYIDLESVDSGKLLKKNIINLDNAPSRAQRLLQDEDVIYQMVRPYQQNNYYFISSDDYDYVASTGYAQLRAFGSSKFLYQLIHTERFVSSVLEKCTGSNYPAINSNALKQIQIQFPTSKNEQQKIASCLSVLDELITAQAKKIEQLQQHKKGLMQGLFPIIES
jgi:type I restriction enzyme S subunit